MTGIMSLLDAALVRDQRPEVSRPGLGLAYLSLVSGRCAAAKLSNGSVSGNVGNVTDSLPWQGAGLASSARQRTSSSSQRFARQ